MNPIEETVQLIPIKDISVESNVRSNMDAKKLDELQATIAVSGMAQPIEVRPNPLFEESYVVTFGHRRLEVAKRLGWKDIPAIVRERPADEVELLQLVENDSREDLKALDRAAQYKQLNHERGWDAARIAKAVGRARSTVELTLRLADLVDAGKKALSDGWLPQGAAEELALLSPGVQKDGLKFLQDLDQDGELTRDRAREVLRRELLLDLAEVKFDPRDAHLVPAAGACIPDCTKRTGAQPDLFGGGKGPDCCTDRPCLRVKEGAWLRLQEKAGVKVLSSAEAKQVFPNDYGHVDRDSGYALADEKDYHHPQSKTYRAQLGKEAKTKVVLARGPDGALVELVARKDLPKASPATSAAKVEKSPAEKRKAEEARVRRIVAERALNAIATAAEAKDLSARDADRLIVEELLEHVGNDRRKLLASFLEDNGELKVGDGWDGATKALRKRFELLKGDAHTLVGFAFQLIGAGALGSYGSLDSLKPACKLLDVDLVEIQKSVELERREKKAAKKTGAKTAKRKAAARDGQLSHGLKPESDSEREEQAEIKAAFAKTTEPTDPIQWLPKKHPKIVAVGLGHDGRRYEVLREKRHDSKAIGFYWRGGKSKEFTAPGDGWGSIVDTELLAKSGAEDHEKRWAERGGR